MARPSLELIQALRTTAERLRGDSAYHWTHMGACNCGHLAQTITRRSREEIHRVALQKAGDWAEQAIEHCPTSGYPIDHILSEMLASGLTLSDVSHLERLNDPKVLRRVRSRTGMEYNEVPTHLDYRRRADVVHYLEAWADSLEDQMTQEHRVIAFPQSGRTSDSGPEVRRPRRAG